MSPWQNVPVVYAVLDPTDSIHYVRVTKGYSGEGDALQMAQVPDSLYYDSLVLNLEEYDGGGQLLRSIPLEKTYLEKESGAFAAGQIPVYITEEALDPWARYELKGNIPRCGSSFSASTQMINGFSPGLSFGIKTSFNFYDGKSEKIDWTAAAHAKRYEVYVRFHYYDLDDHYDSTAKVVEYLAEETIVPNTAGGATMSIYLKGTTFVNQVKTMIGPANGLKRKAGELEIIVRSVDEELNTYLSLNKQSEVSSQAPPFYTNVENGAGIVAARSTYYGSNRKLSDRALDSLSRSPLTRQLNFADSDGRFHGE
jgi:hypothetical protein